MPESHYHIRFKGQLYKNYGSWSPKNTSHDYHQLRCVLRICILLPEGG